MSKFTQQDYDTFQEVVKFLINKPKWELSTQEVIQLNKYLIFLNSINTKIQSNILEITKVVEPEPKKKARTTRSKK